MNVFVVNILYNMKHNLKRKMKIINDKMHMVSCNTENIKAEKKIMAHRYGQALCKSCIESKYRILLYLQEILMGICNGIGSCNVYTMRWEQIVKTCV